MPALEKTDGVHPDFFSRAGKQARWPLRRPFPGPPRAGWYAMGSHATGCMHACMHAYVYADILPQGDSSTRRFPPPLFHAYLHLKPPIHTIGLRIRRANHGQHHHHHHPSSPGQASQPASQPAIWHGRGHPPSPGQARPLLQGNQASHQIQLGRGGHRPPPGQAGEPASQPSNLTTTAFSPPQAGRTSSPGQPSQPSN